ncbi:23S rRNA pseudouridine(955/2504/2580) synthase RluC [Cellvibrio polysaccharolyticus]|uniref:Pseudouridine synthase n=1 Tax=Cellvibrio polysaccharolyticus TaxID=2082724 RepID=A0A928V2U1_9GAMM|nr:23S rRNA pseudouridine(955/2504/2580) synthase RluC [Cellvibrio polysaccharolyticus]MBE8717730.1 23S rRNA pseudouridine(955/2504/2580) synthase RluC [Cellvibrio polysaccharolyticus]
MVKTDASGGNLSVRLVAVDEDQAGQRLDNFLSPRLKGVPKSRIYNLIRKGEVRVNKGRSKPDYKLAAGDVVRIPPVRVAESAAVAVPGKSLVQHLEQAVLYEDDGLLVINKPSGLAVHGGSGVNLGLIESLRQIRPENRFLELVHRLDKDTSGCIMIAKKRSVLRHLQSALRDKTGPGVIRKVYQALVIGHWPNSCLRVDAPLLKREVAGGERIVRVSTDGKPSLTEFAVLKRFQDFTLIEARPITGRTHQIRVHAKYAGHSLLGDEKYGNDGINEAMRSHGFRRLFLHAAALEFDLPGVPQRIRVDAALPDDLAQALTGLQ